ncbi:glycosyltransferase family 4 protein [Candidatus Woesearchaeota archaeon]|nr:glycosyltransferase family 4 protein [Candidatus Woesearchaeota archaeon]
MANYFYPTTGGMEELTFNIAKELIKRGHEVHVFTSDRKDTQIFSKEEIVEGIQIHRSTLYFNYKYYLKFNPNLAVHHLKYKLDVLHVQSFGFFFQDIAVLLRKIFTKTKLINTPHGPFMALDKYPLWQKIFRELYVTFEYPINKLYDTVIQVNPEQYKWMKKYGCKNIYFIPNSIPEELFTKISTKTFIEKYKLKNKFVISYLGRVQKYKGLEQVIRVLPELITLQPNLVFLVMGGEVDNEIQRLTEIAKELKVENNVVFTGRIPSKLEGLKSTEIFILPSEWEAFGIVLIEAMAQGCALISTQTEGGKFLIENNKQGYLFNYKNLNELKEKLTLLITNKPLLKNIQKNNLKESEKYSITRVIKEYEKVYSKEE